MLAAFFRLISLILTVVIVVAFLYIAAIAIILFKLFIFILEVTLGEEDAKEFLRQHFNYFSVTTTNHSINLN